MAPDLDNLTIAQLKVMAYDQIALIQKQKEYLDFVNEKIAEKFAAVPKSESVADDDLTMAKTAPEPVADEPQS